MGEAEALETEGEAVRVALETVQQKLMERQQEDKSTEGSGARPSESEQSAGTTTDEPSRPKMIRRFRGMKMDKDEATVEEDNRSNALTQQDGIEDFLTFMSYSVDGPGWRSANARIHADVAGMSFSIANRLREAFRDSLR